MERDEEHIRDEKTLEEYAEDVENIEEMLHTEEEENTKKQREERAASAREREAERRRRERIRQKRLAKKRQLQRRRMLQLIAMAAVLVLVIALIGKGVHWLFTRNNNKLTPTEVITEVQASYAGEAGKQPILSAADIEKLSDGTTVLGWQENEKGKWYRNADGTFYQSGWKEIDGYRYYFDENGYVVQGWLEIDGVDYYFNDDGRYDGSKIRPVIALTFDDGPGEYTSELLDCLEENHAKATFFMLGQNVANYPNLVARMEETGMELGNHTYNHKNLTNLSNDSITEEITSTNDAIERAAGVPADTLRPPGGSVNKTVQRMANMPIIKWSIDTKDWSTKSEEETYQVIMNNAQDGSVILLHDVHEWSVKASLRAIPELIEKGFKLVTIQELAEAKGIELEDGEIYLYFGEGYQQVE